MTNTHMLGLYFLMAGVLAFAVRGWAGLGLAMGTIVFLNLVDFVYVERSAIHKAFTRYWKRSLKK